jgi:uncharacterized cysteine cluster protein YcgN (CxxCxxCC family)
MNESTCNQCGECCRLKVKVGDRKVLLNIYCPALDLDTKTCMMYDWRHTERGKELRGGSECATMMLGLWRGLFPSTCAYVKRLHPTHDYDESKLGLVPWAIWADTLARVSRMRKRIKESLCQDSANQ